MMPSLFVAHGTPTLAIELNGYIEFLRELPERLPAKPSGIVLFSAHWESRVQKVSSVLQYETMHDFAGFPEELCRLSYPARGDVTLSMAVQELLREEGIPCEEDAERGLDHGAWVPLLLLYPQSDVPVTALSVHPRLAAEEQYRIGRALAPLRERGVLILGSGGYSGMEVNGSGITGGGEADGWAVAFEEWVGEQLETWNTDALFDYERRAPYAREAVPTPEHLAPLLIAMGAADGENEATLLHREYRHGGALTCWQFGGEVR